MNMLVGLDLGAAFVNAVYLVDMLRKNRHDLALVNGLCVVLLMGFAGLAWR